MRMVRVQLPVEGLVAHPAAAHPSLQGDDQDARGLHRLGGTPQAGAAGGVRGVVEVRRGHVRGRRHVPGEVSGQDQHRRAHQDPPAGGAGGSRGGRPAAARRRGRRVGGRPVRPRDGPGPAHAQRGLARPLHHRHLADADHRQRRVGRRQQHDPALEPVHAAGRRSAQAACAARRRGRRGPQKGGVPARMRHALDGPGARRRRCQRRARARQVPLHPRQGGL
mmetsp:Transcript_11524/g.36900  ORF Transcript_11524/g.36900 Transcript_11524/m.36900 type:complete len:222 (+) Transcript_11524:1956-2621(+)